MKNFKSFLMRSYFRLFTRNMTIEKIDIKYLLQRNRKSKRLIVVFSGWPANRIAGYNYVRTLINIKENKLFIIDDEGYENLGTYYLGNSCRWLQNDLIEKIVTICKEKCNAEEVIFAGSSKGATCALLYGLRMNVNAVICGSPQYRIAWYLQHSGDHQKKTFPLLMEDSIYSEEEIDSLLKDAIDLPNRKTKIRIMYSSLEYLYPYDMYMLINKLESSSLDLVTNDMSDKGYNDHSDVAYYYKPFLLKYLNELKKDDTDTLLF